MQLFASYAHHRPADRTGELATADGPATRVADDLVLDQYQDVAAVYATRSELMSNYPPHALFDGATSIRACGLSLNLICQQYGMHGLRRLVERDGSIRCLFLDWDDLAIWTGSVISRHGRWHMLYTGISRSESGLVHRIGLAVSDDLLRWEKHPANPVLQADPRWCELLDLGH